MNSWTVAIALLLASLDSAADSARNQGTWLFWLNVFFVIFWFAQFCLFLRNYDVVERKELK